MKVLHIGPKNYPPNHGGVEKVVWDIIQGMDGYESHVYTEWPCEAVNVNTLTRGLFQQWNQVRAYVKSTGIDIIHLHKETFIPLALLLRLSGYNCLLTLHGCAWRISRWPFLIRILFFVLDCMACCILKKVVFVGAYDWNLFRRLFPFSDTVLICNGIDADMRNNVAERSGWVYVGRLSPEKNILAMIRAAAQANIPLDLYGPFDRRDDAFKELVLEALKECNTVHWHGPIPSETVRPTLARYAVFVNLSLSEGLPVSVLEAAAEGLYLVLSDIPQHRVLAIPKCVYVNPHNPDFKGITNIRGCQEDNCIHVRKMFGLDQMIRKYLDVYESFCS